MKTKTLKVVCTNMNVTITIPNFVSISIIRCVLVCATADTKENSVQTRFEWKQKPQIKISKISDIYSKPKICFPSKWVAFEMFEWKKSISDDRVWKRFVFVWHSSANMLSYLVSHNWMCFSVAATEKTKVYCLLFKYRVLIVCSAIKFITMAHNHAQNIYTNQNFIFNTFTFIWFKSRKKRKSVWLIFGNMLTEFQLKRTKTSAVKRVIDSSGSLPLFILRFQLEILWNLWCIANGKD